jgi:hypothetical protein
LRSFNEGLSPAYTVSGLPSASDAGGADSGTADFDGAGGAPWMDAAASLPPSSPLCSALPTTCNPDQATTAKACDLAPDGGPYDSEDNNASAPLACRVVATANGTATTIGPTCAPAGSLGDGARCKVSSDCLPTYECVADGASDGGASCQRYCCAGNVECGVGEFCDIGTLAQSSAVAVPVCVPLQPSSGCKLLEAAQCPALETCAVVRENGATSCVAVGTAAVHESCDSAHCAAGLVCLGAVGQRECYELCHTSGANMCPSPETCKGGLPLFPDPSVGICQ